MRLIPHEEISRIEVWPNTPLLAIASSQFILESVRRNPESRITWATGDTMIPVYSTLAETGSCEGVLFENIWAFHLDEYWPASPDQDDFSFVKYLRTRVFEPLRIPLEHRMEINGMAKYPEVEASWYDRLLSEGPIALAILGIGPGCHMGFNERGTPIQTRTHFGHLSVETIYRDHVERQLPTPEDYISQGPANIFGALSILMVAFNPTKGGYLREALYGPIKENCPASELRQPGVGEKVTIIIDEAAAEVLEGKQELC